MSRVNRRRFLRHSLTAAATVAAVPYIARAQGANEKLGAAVIRPNVRGSDGYGKHYLSLDNGFKRENSVRDIGALLDWIETQPDLDQSRVAVFGGSYGG